MKKNEEHDSAMYRKQDAKAEVKVRRSDDQSSPARRLPKT